MASGNETNSRASQRRGHPLTLCLAAMALLVAGACAAPARRLTPRVVDDPIVLPRGMAHVTGAAGFRQARPGGFNHWIIARFRLGITDRLEWTDVLQLRYALLDDRPPDGRTPAPLSVALRGGVYGIGYSSVLGAIVYPTLAVETLKHLGDAWAFGAALSWYATWTQHRIASLQDPNMVDEGGGRRSVWSLNASATRQLPGRFALSLTTWLDHTGACYSPTCDSIRQSAGAVLHLQSRPWHWMTAGVGPYAGGFRRPEVVPVLTDPSLPAAPPPQRTGTWIGLSARVAFHW